MSEFTVPTITHSPTEWGPTTVPSQYENLPYAPFAKSDKLGKSADFTSSAAWLAKFQKPDKKPTGDNVVFNYARGVEDTFQLVDNVKMVKPQTSWKKRAFLLQHKRGNSAVKGRGITSKDTDVLITGGKDHRNQPQRNKWAKQRAANFGKGTNRSTRNMWNRIDRQPSVKVGKEWKFLVEYTLQEIKELKANRPEVEDLEWCGFLDTYNDSYDKIDFKNPLPLKRITTKEFYPVTTTDDPVIEKLAIEGKGNVFATDAIISHLMAQPRSVYPWDIVIQKLPNGAIFFDKRDDSQFDYLTVSESAFDPPQSNDDDPDCIDAPEALGLEATMINQNFSQQILRPATGKTRRELDNPNPFFDEEDSEGMEPASVGYRYRKFTMGSIDLVIRCELHGIINKKGVAGVKKEYMNAYSLNEWDGKRAGGIEWRKKFIDGQRGAILATELKNNSCKLAKWGCSSLLAGAEQIKLGYVSRVSKTSAARHHVMATQQFKPKDFLQQINMHEQTMWGIMKMLIELVRRQEAGKFVLMRDPNKAIVRLYQVPMSTFEESDEEESDEDEEEEKGSDAEE